MLPIRSLRGAEALTLRRASKPGALPPGACLAMLLSLSGPALAQWKSVSDRDGIHLESRTVAGERYDEFRVTTLLKTPPEAVADYVFGNYLDQKNKAIQRTFIERGTKVTVWADVLHLPMVSERCYAMRFERQRPTSAGTRVRFATLDGHAVAGKPGCVALRARGEWVLAPAGTGTRLTYVSLTDIGGRVPAGLARRSLADAAVMSVRKVAAGAAGLPLPRGAGE